MTKLFIAVLAATAFLGGCTVSLTILACSPLADTASGSGVAQLASTMSLATLAVGIPGSLAVRAQRRRRG